MAQTRAVLWRRPANINFDLRRVAAAKEIANHRRNSIKNIKIKILLPQGKDVEVKTSRKHCKKNESSKRCNIPWES